MASPSDPPTDRAGDTAQFPVTRVSTAAATDTDDVPSTGGPAHAVTAGTPGISRAGWWAITIAAAVLLVLGFLLTFGPARYWTPVPVVFLGYFLLSGVIGLVFWKGVRELRDSNPTLHSGDGPATPGARVAAAIGAVGVASALVLLPAGLSDAPANAAPCPDGSNTCGPQPTMGPQPTQGNGGNTTAPQAPNTTVPGYTPPDTPPQQGNGSTPTVQGQVPTMPTGDSPSNGCIFNCGPTQAPQTPQTGQANPPQTGQQQNPVTTAPNTPATTPQATTTTPRLRTPTPETTTSTTSSKARDDQQRSSDEDRDQNSGTPYQAAEIAALAGTYRRRKVADTARDATTVATQETSTVIRDAGNESGDNFTNDAHDITDVDLAEVKSADLAVPAAGLLEPGNGLVYGPPTNPAVQQAVWTPPLPKPPSMGPVPKPTDAIITDTECIPPLVTPPPPPPPPPVLDSVSPPGMVADPSVSMWEPGNGPVYGPPSDPKVLAAITPKAPDPSLAEIFAGNASNPLGLTNTAGGTGVSLATNAAGKMSPADLARIEGLGRLATKGFGVLGAAALVRDDIDKGMSWQKAVVSEGAGAALATAIALAAPTGGGSLVVVGFGLLGLAVGAGLTSGIQSIWPK
ncbi:phage holin family protein [Tsukamurella tyrosinosolvens]|uniref:phage holin family protein n=1 Tax=Tsukamurella tyrosinosolvens TaxID=57704 RepID=UPI000DF7091B|nr:phage holin family protein [Tsukamurella tyrosinosolvens]RDB49403.1 hypothetical protein DVB87_03145 [Tsukamurella tyrosinosolvens]